jgi:hypothetical protein
VFDDLLTLAVCALAGGTREEQYLKTVKPYTGGKPGERVIDRLIEVFARLLAAMEESDADILGDMFQAGISRGREGQHFTPSSVSDLMARLVDGDERRELEVSPGDLARQPRTVHDPCCGSGRPLLAAAKVNRASYLVGQDVDHMCVKITALNLALRGLSGAVIWGNTLTNEVCVPHRVQRPRLHSGGRTRGIDTGSKGKTVELAFASAGVCRRRSPAPRHVV